VRQLSSSLFDAVVGVTVLLAIPAAVLHPRPGVLAVAVIASLLLAGRVLIERSNQRARG
jgi:hypothetical protein